MFHILKLFNFNIFEKYYKMLSCDDLTFANRLYIYIFKSTGNKTYKQIIINKRSLRFEKTSKVIQPICPPTTNIAH